MSETRRILLPSGKLRFRWKWAVAIWLALCFILPAGLFYFTMLVGFMSVSSPVIERFWEVGTNVLLSITIAVILLPPLVALGIVTTQAFFPRVFKGLFFPILYETPGRDSKPIEYQRICPSCNFRWTWKPGKPNRAGKMIQSSKSGNKKVVELPSEKQRKKLRVKVQREQAQAYLPYLLTLKAHWQNSFTPPAETNKFTTSGAEKAFRKYRRALGEPIEIEAGHSISGYIRRYFPSPFEKHAFMQAYADLVGGKDEVAAATLKELTQNSPKFADPWIWITATFKDQPLYRIEYLRTAVRLEPAHPLGRAALAIAMGEISLDEDWNTNPEMIAVTVVNCPKCGGSLQDSPGDGGVTCAYCGYFFAHQEHAAAAEAPQVRTLRLQRKFQPQTWELVRILSCQACGAILTHTQHLAQQCACCGSTNVLVLERQQDLIRPDALVPFQITREQVVKLTLGEHNRRSASIETLEGIFVPFWVFDGEVDRQILFVRDKEVVSAHFDQIYEFDNLPFAGVDIPPPSMTDQLPSFDLSQMIEYEPRYLADWPAQLYTHDVEWVVEDAYDTMFALGVKKAGPPVIEGITPPPGSRAAVSLNVTQTTYQLVLLPVWVMTIEIEGRRRLFLINGQTGEVVKDTWSDNSKPRRL